MYELAVDFGNGGGNRNRRTLIWQSAAMVFFLICCVTASAQWSKKPYAEWSEEEAQRVLADSPWAARVRFLDMGRTDSSVSQALPPSRNPEPYRDYNKYPPADPRLEAPKTSSTKIIGAVDCHIRLLSARPTREAFARSPMIRENGEKITGQIKALADADFANYIIIAISCDSKESSGLLVRVQSALTPNPASAGGQNRVLLTDTFLETKAGRRVLPQRYQPPRDNRLGALLMFPRLVDGKPFIAPDSGEFRFYMNPYKTFAIDVRFKVKEMSYEGKLEY